MRIPLLLVVLIALGLAPAAHAGIRIGPYLQAVTTDSIQVLWETNVDSTGEVHYGTDLTMSSTVPSTGTGKMHQVELTGLSPSTLYHYEVQTTDGTSSPFTFLTAPLPNEPFNLVFIGDTRTNHWDHEDVVEKMIEVVGYPDLIVNTGDLVDDGGEADQWEEFFSIEHDIAARGTIAAASGNHDDGGGYALFDQYFEAASQNPGEHWYSFDYGNLHLLVIDTQDDFMAGSAQYEFIHADLQAASQDPTIEHLWVAGHWPAYSSGAHGIADHEEWGAVRDWLQPLFEAYGVQIYWCGHDHHYERSVVNGVTYIVTGGGGAPADLTDFLPEELAEIIQDLGIIDTSVLYGDMIEMIPGWQLLMLALGMEYDGNDWSLVGYMTNHFVSVQITGSLFEAVVHDADGTILDSWSYGISDPSEIDDDGDGYSENEGDCDDGNADVHPDATEECNGIDDNCDGQVDEGCDDDDTADDDTADDDTADDDAADDDATDPVGSDDDTFPGGCECALNGDAADLIGALPLLGLGAALVLMRRRR